MNKRNAFQWPMQRFALANAKHSVYFVIRGPFCFNNDYMAVVCAKYRTTCTSRFIGIQKKN